MKDNDFLKGLHIGSMIRKIAFQKNISAQKLAETIGRYENNAAKIYQKTDMDTEEAIHISDVLEHNLLEMISCHYLSHLPFFGLKQESHFILFDKYTGRYTIKGNAGNRDFLHKVNIGEHIKEIVEKKGWIQQEMGKRSGLPQSHINRLYQSTKMNVKKLIRISIALNHNLLAEVYLSRMCIVPFRYKLDDCTIRINEQEVRIENPVDSTFLMEYVRLKSDK